jgi:DNA processing protein
VAYRVFGADFVFRPEQAATDADVVGHGALVSEHPPGTPPLRGHFPRRNRIVAALCAAIVVVEAPTRSGALVTARLATEIGREVLAVPGPVDREGHRGCHRLLREGARLCEGAADVWRALYGDLLDDAQASAAAPLRAARPPPAPGPPLVVWQALDPDDPLTPDELALRAGLSADAVACALTALELDGRVLRVAGGLLRVL